MCCKVILAANQPWNTTFLNIKQEYNDGLKADFKRKLKL